MKGETLIEVLIALTIAVVVISSITVLSVSSLSNAQFVRDQDQSGQYTQEGLEIMRKLRNSNYVGYRGYNGTYCLDKDQTTLGSAVSACATPNMDTRYIRFVQIEQGGDCGVNLAETSVTVLWTSNKCASGTYCHSSRLSSCFSTIPPITGP